MEIAIAFGIGIVCGAAMVWFANRDHQRYLRDELKSAHAQIAHAVLQEGTQVPMRFEQPEPIEALSAQLQEVINDWEDPESRAIQEAQIRHWLGEGRDERQILRQYRANP